MKRENIFVSYRRTDLNGNTSGTDIARTIKQHLEISGYKDQVFFDYSEISDDEFERTILREIERSKVMILVLTNDTMYRCVSDHDWVRREILHAVKHNVKIIPIEVDNLFNGYPENLCEELDIIKRLHHSKVHMDSSFENDMNAIIEKRIKPILKPTKSFNFKFAFIALFFIVAIIVTLGIIGSNKENKTIVTTEDVVNSEDNTTSQFKITIHEPTIEELDNLDKGVKIQTNVNSEFNSKSTDNFNLLPEIYREDNTLIYEWGVLDIDINIDDNATELLKEREITYDSSLNYIINRYVCQLISGAFCNYDYQYTDILRAVHTGMDIMYIFEDCNGEVIDRFGFENEELIEAIEEYCINITHEPQDKEIEWVKDRIEFINAEFLPMDLPHTYLTLSITDIELSEECDYITLKYKTPVDDKEGIVKTASKISSMINHNGEITYIKEQYKAFICNQQNIFTFLCYWATILGIDFKYIYYGNNGEYIGQYDIDISNVTELIKRSLVVDLQKFEENR